MSDERVLETGSPREQVGLSLCMIVRDAARTLEPCLTSVRPWVDEMVVVDTGSADDTARIAQALGARVFHFPWQDDFAAARNESLRHARGPWIFWMDADDTIDQANGAKLRRLAHRPHEASVWGYVMQVHCPGGDGTGDFTAVDHVKVFRNRAELRFEGRIHEQILPAIRRAGADVAWTDLFVTHSGSDHSPEGRRKKHERDLRILYLDLEERPGHPFVLFNLGMTYADMGRHEVAAQWLRRSIDAAKPTESHLRKAYALLAASLHQLDRRKEAEEVCRRGLGLFADDPELLFRRGMLAHEAGQLEEAAEAYRQTLAAPRHRYFASIDRGVVGCKARHNLACVYADMAQPDLAEIQWRRIVEESPQNVHARRRLVEALLRRHRLVSAGLEREKLDDAGQEQCETIVLHARLDESRGRLAEARNWLRTAVDRFPLDPVAWEAMGRFSFAHGEPGEAVGPLSELTRLQPANGAAFYNLGLAQLRAGQVAKAVDSLRVSLRLRPDSRGAREQLNLALELFRQDKSPHPSEPQDCPHFEEPGDVPKADPNSGTDHPAAVNHLIEEGRANP